MAGHKSSAGEPVLLVVAHPGHELRLYGWASVVKPQLHVLTDGAGRTGQGRLGESRSLAHSIGMSVGSIFGHASDRRFYEAMLALDVRFFADLAEKLAAAIEVSGAGTVAGDAAEGYNPSHDMTRVIIDCAVVLARRRTGRTVANLVFPVVEWSSGVTIPPDAQIIDLDPAALAAKIAACHAYRSLNGEVLGALDRLGESYFARERLWAVPDGVGELPGPAQYDEIGARRVADGAYREAVLRDRHLVPLRQALAAHALGDPVVTVAGKSLIALADGPVAQQDRAALS